MPDEIETLLRRLISGDQGAVAAVLAGARTSDVPALLVAAALISGDGDGLLLARARSHATTTRDRQLVAVAAAHLEGDHDLFDALIRDHLAGLAAAGSGSGSQAPASPRRSCKSPAYRGGCCSFPASATTPSSRRTRRTPTNFAGYVIWCSWLVAMAIVLWRGRPHADGSTSSPDARDALNVRSA